jgi:hypothetical protein
VKSTVGEHSIELGHCILLKNTPATWPKQVRRILQGSDRGLVLSGTITEASRPTREVGYFPQAPFGGAREVLSVIKFRFPSCLNISCLLKRRLSFFFARSNFLTKTLANNCKSPFPVASPLPLTYDDKPLLPFQ